MSVAEYQAPATTAVAAHPDLPAGVIVGGPLVEAKRLESTVLFGTFTAGSIAASGTPA